VKKEQKSEVVKSLEAALDSHSTFYLVDFKRMKVSQAVELRKLLRKNAFVYKVVKNRLALRALRDKCPAEVKPFFEKPTAIAFAADNPIGLAKILKDFSAQGKVLAVKSGVVEGQYMAPERFDELTKLSSRNDLVAKIGFLMASPLTRLLRTLQAPLGNMGNLLGQLKAKKPDGQ
jgi:large subunit ribosomal protein L10